MYKSRTEKLLLLAIQNEEIDKPQTEAVELKSASIRAVIDVENTFESEGGGPRLNLANNTSPEIIDCLPTELTELKPVSLVIDLPSASRPNVVDIFESADDTHKETNNITASTSQLIDFCLDENVFLNEQDFLLTSDNELNIAEIPLVDVANQINDSTTPNIHKKGFTCFHCSLVFSNKKDVRNHIVHIHMETTISSDEEPIGSETVNNLDSTLHQQKKIKNEERDTSVKKRNHKKNLRMSGKAYKNSKGKFIQGRKRKECICKCSFKCNDIFSDEVKDNIFASYWKMAEDDKSQDRQRQYLISHVKEKEPTRRYTVNSRKKRTLQYFLPKENEQVQVCRTFFLSIFDITEKFLRVCLEKKSDTGVVLPDKRGKSSCQQKIPDFIEKHARDHILSIPKVESHYCRQSTSLLYLSSQLNIERLYCLYLEKCKEDNVKISEENSKTICKEKKDLIKPVSKSLYKKYFYSYSNLRFHKPKKDQCNTCRHYDGLSQEEKEKRRVDHEKHLSNKTRAREMKHEEIKSCIENPSLKKTVLNCDLQAVLECPKGEVSSIFYKRKLAVYNFTIFDLINKEGTCCLWDETEGNRGSTEVASCLFNYIKIHPEIEEIFLMSDSCGGQNLNQYLSTALLHAVKLTNCKVIHHVYYEQGHTQMEGDSMHSCIERSAKNIQVNVPSEWYLLCQVARKNPSPYKIMNMTHTNFIDWTSLADENKDTARYQTTEGEIVEWRKIKCFKYEKNHPDVIFFKYNYDDAKFEKIKVLKSKRHKFSLFENLPKAYTSRLPITWAKYKDLMDLCETRVIPVNHHEFYKNLPHLPKPQKVKDKTKKENLTKTDNPRQKKKTTTAKKVKKPKENNQPLQI